MVKSSSNFKTCFLRALFKSKFNVVLCLNVGPKRIHYLNMEMEKTYGNGQT